MTAWKDLERRVCAALGGRRGGPIGAAVSDCVGTPWAVEVKRTASTTGGLRGAWIQQARDQAAREGRKYRWLLVVAGHNDRHPIVCLDFAEFVDLARRAGVIPRVEDAA